MKFRASKEIGFDAGHRVPNHASKCANPHGHRYRVVATIEGELSEIDGASDEGMVLDFGDLKAILLTEIHDRFDHGFMVYEGDEAMRRALEAGQDWKVAVLPCIPTAENLAAICFYDVDDALQARWGDDRARLVELTIWETPSSSATVTP